MPPIPPEIKENLDAIAEAIVYLYTESRRLTKGMAARFGLTGPQLTVVKMLESLGDMSLSELSDRIHAQNSTVTGIIDRMEREGLVKRARLERDRRVVHIQLTDKGAALAEQIPLQPAEILREAVGRLSPADALELLRILTGLAHEVRNIVVHSSPPEETL